MRIVSLTDLAAATRGQLLGCFNPSAFVGRVEIDSRRIQPGDFFWALSGEHHDGHDFLAEARSRGASAAIVRRDKLAQAQQVWNAAAVQPVVAPLIAVDDTLTALADFAGWHRSQHDSLVIGVTGSFGKTTTREMIYSVLAAARSGIRSLKNYNNHIGLPLSLLELNDEHEFAVLEMGASAVGEIAALADIARPQVGVITGIGLAHVEGFGSPQRIEQAKGELLEALPRDGLAVLPGDDPVTRRMASRTDSRVLFVGEQDGNHVQAKNVRVENQRLWWEVGGEKYSVPAVGRHFVPAALTALAIAREFGLSHSDVAGGLEQFQPAPGRCEVHHVGPWTVIDDSYNANPHSMKAACETLSNWRGAHKKLLVTGDMLELGEHAEQSHYELGQAAAAAQVDGLLIFGQYAERVARGARDGGLPCSRLAVCDHFEDVLTVLEHVLEPQDVVLIKGSRGMRLERVLHWLRERSETLSTGRCLLPISAIRNSSGERGGISPPVRA